MSKPQASATVGLCGVVASLLWVAVVPVFGQSRESPNPGEDPVTLTAPVRRRDWRQNAARRERLLPLPIGKETLGPTLAGQRPSVPAEGRNGPFEPTPAKAPELAAATPSKGADGPSPASEVPARTSPNPKPVTSAQVAATGPVPPKSIWTGLFERAPLGFDLQTPRRSLAVLTETLAEWTRSPGVLWAALRRITLTDWIGFAGFFLLVAVTLVAERAPINARRRWRGSIFRAVRKHPVLRVLLWICWITLPLVLAWASWTLAGRLLHWQDQAGFSVGQKVLSVWIGFRAACVSLHLLVRRFDLNPRLGARLGSILKFAAFWLIVWLVIDWIDAPDDVVALWGKAGHLILVMGLFAALRSPEPIVSMLPTEGRAGRMVRPFVSNLYAPLVYASLAIALLWVCGFERLAEVFLGRGWALIGLAVGAALIYRHTIAYFERILGERQEDALQRKALIEGARPGIGVLVAGAAGWFGLRILELQQPIEVLFALVWIRVGSIAITGNALWGCAVFVAGSLLVSRWLQPYLAYRVYPNVGVAAGEAYAINRLLHYALVAGGMILALNSLGLPPSSLAIILGGLSVGIGFGLQEIANNLASGLILLTSRQVRQGDLISVGDRMGTVREVNLRSTVVTTGDNVDLLIPNSKLLGDVLVNWTYSNSVGMAKVPFGVAYGSKVDQVMAVALEIANQHPEVLDEPCPEVLLINLNDSSIDFELLVRVDIRRSVRPRVVSALYLRLIEEFEARGIEIPFPQREVRLLNDGLGHDRDGSGSSPNIEPRSPRRLWLRPKATPHT